MTTSTQQPAGNDFAPVDGEERSNGHALMQRPDIQPVAGTEATPAALAARARAEIEARTFLALNRPRDMRRFQARIEERCRNPLFAEVARYQKPVGKEKIEGFSIRMAEECVKHYGNLDITSIVISDDDQKRVVQVHVSDLESNATWRAEVVVSKTIERSFAKPGDEIVRTRTNSKGRPVYIRRATDDEIMTSQNSAISKAVRNLIFKQIPGEIMERCEEIVTETLADVITKDPRGFAVKLEKAFMKLGVSREQLEEFLGKSYDKVNPAELFVLRSIGEGIRQGEATWADVMAEKRGESVKPTEKAQPASSAVADVVAAAKKNVEAAQGVEITTEAQAFERYVKLRARGGIRTDEETSELDDLSNDNPQFAERYQATKGGAQS